MYWVGFRAFKSPLTGVQIELTVFYYVLFIGHHIMVESRLRSLRRNESVRPRMTAKM